MSKLLNKPFRAFTLYALVILACSIPVYYIVVNSIWMSELDEHNLIVKDQISNRLTKVNVEPVKLEQVLKLWNVLQPGTTLTPDVLLTKKDSLYTITRENQYVKGEIDRFRGLLTSVKINGKAYTLRVETNVEEADETIMAISMVTLFFFLILVTGFIFLNRRIAGNVWHPFYDTLEKLRAFDLSSNTSLAFNKSSITEFEELHKVLQKLIENNMTAFRQQKVFIENASHELQTPLAVLKSKTDLLLQDKDITTDQAEILNTIQSQLAKVTRINKNLLLLARIENSQFPERKRLNLPDILQENIALLADYIGDRKVTLLTPAGTPFFISCNKFLLETLINNLLTNAIKHSVIASDILIELRENTLYFFNAGENLLNKENLFKRFSISSSETTNSGLGLAIVKEITIYHEWHVDYSFRDGMHCFSVVF